MILNVFKRLFVRGNEKGVILTTACVVYSSPHSTFLFPSPTCDFKRLLSHSELDNNIHYSISRNLIPQNSVA